MINCPNCEKECKNDFGLKAHLRACKVSEGVDPTEDLENFLEDNSVPSTGIKEGDWVQHIYLGFKFKVEAIEDGKAGWAVQKKAADEGKLKWVSLSELKPYDYTKHSMTNFKRK